MPVISGPPKEKITIGITPKNMKNIANAMSSNQYSTVTDVVNDALAYFFDNRDKSEGKAIKEFMESSEGEELFKKLFKKYEESVSNRQE
jgi:hypothetical protein